MKANRKFTRNDQAVSPVIGVILMVAITVVLAATVYVWASGFGRGSETARAVALATDGVMDADGDKTFIISSASSSLRWEDIAIQIDGVKMDIGTTASCPDATTSTFYACSGTTTLASTSPIQAGHALKIRSTPGATLRIIDLQANSVMYTTMLG